MIWSARRLKQSLKLTPQVLSTVLVALVPMALMNWGMEYGVSRVHQSRFSAPMESSVAIIILIGLGAFILESLIAVFWLTLIAHSTEQALNKKEANSFQFVFQHFHQTLIEYVRAIVSVGLYSMALIVPGLIRWVRLTFTCYISLFNKQYHKGKVDALEESSKITQGHFFSLFLLLIVFALIPMVLEKGAWALGGGHFLAIFFFYGLSWLTTVVLAVYISLTYFSLAEKSESNR